MGAQCAGEDGRVWAAEDMVGGGGRSEVAVLGAGEEAQEADPCRVWRWRMWVGPQGRRRPTGVVDVDGKDRGLSGTSLSFHTKLNITQETETNEKL